MNSKQFFEIALGDIRPWEIKHIELKQLDEKVRELHIGWWHILTDTIEVVVVSK